MTDNARDGCGRKRPASNIDAALDLTKRGFHVFPIKPGAKDPPLVKWKTGATNDPNKIRCLWADYPAANIGVATGPSGLFVVDVDVRDGKPGEQSLDFLELDWGELPPTLTARTASGGRHLYFKGAVKSRNGYLGEGVDAKSLGGYVVAPGSRLEDGGQYQWEEPDALIADAPEWLVKLAEPQRVEYAFDGSVAGDMEPELLARILAQIPVEDFRDHDAWFDMMCACHHATAGLGREEFSEWSTADPEYADHAHEISGRWNSLHLDLPGKQRPITKAHLFGTLYRYGGHETYCSPEEDFEPIDLGALEEPSLLDRMNERFAVVNDGGFRIIEERRDPILGRRHYVRMTKTDFCNFLLNQRVEVPSGDGTKAIPLGHWWLAQPGRRQYEGIIFDPEQNYDGWLNLWRGWAVEPEPGDWSLLAGLVRDVLCADDDASFEYVLNWSAHMVQHPATTAEVALAFKGEKGTGKGTFGRALVALAGNHGLHISSPAHLTGRFNSHLRDCICLFADEAFWAGDKAGESVLKQLITEPTLAYEAKGRDVESGRNMIHVVIASNSDWVVPAGLDGERRFAVFEATNARQSDGEFFGKLNEQLKRGGLSGMLHDLLRRDIRGWAPRQGIPQTAALAEQKLRSMDQFQTWWHGVLLRGSLMQQRSDWAAGPTTVVADHLRYDYEESCKAAGFNRPGSPDQLGRWLHRNVPGIERKQVGASRDDAGVRVTSGNRVVAYVMPSLAECRAAFEKALGQPGQWPEE